MSNDQINNKWKQIVEVVNKMFSIHVVGLLHTLYLYKCNNNC